MINTLLIILEQSLLHLPLMLGAYISFSLMKVPDLSIESAYVFGALLGSQTLIGMPSGIPMGLQLLLIIIASMIGGACVGLVSSTITQKARIPHLLSSIITFGLFHGINQFISKAYVSLSALPNPMGSIGLFAKYPELPTLIILGAAISILGFLLLKTQLGYAYAVYGNNPQFFNNYGVSTPYIFITGITIANAMAGISGYLFAQSNTFTELNMGMGKALLCISALILGKALIKTKKPYSIYIPIAGTCAYFALQQMLLKIGFDLKYFTAMQSIIVLLILVYKYRKSHVATDNLGV
jgi:putative ABC transport system permease protein